ncbi:MAG: hypothetical protein WAP56_05930, partial [Acetivibrionales bacterium]
NRIQTMVLSMRSLRRGSHLLFIDDFMKGGGTTKGILELAREFDCQVTGAGVLIETAMPDRKLPIDYFSLLTLYGVDEAAGITDIRPSRMVGYKAQIPDVDIDRHVTTGKRYCCQKKQIAGK